MQGASVRAAGSAVGVIVLLLRVMVLLFLIRVGIAAS